MNTETGVYYALTGVGPELVRAFEDGLALEPACERIAERTSHDFAAVLADGREFVTALEKHGLIQSDNDEDG